MESGFGQSSEHSIKNRKTCKKYSLTHESSMPIFCSYSVLNVISTPPTWLIYGASKFYLVKISSGSWNPPCTSNDRGFTFSPVPFVRVCNGTCLPCLCLGFQNMRDVQWFPVSQYLVSCEKFFENPVRQQTAEQLYIAFVVIVLGSSVSLFTETFSCFWVCSLCPLNRT